MAEGPVWTAFDPDTIDDDALGWLYWEGEWLPVAMAFDGDSPALVFIHAGAPADTSDWQDPELYKGRPFIPAHKPSVTPGKCDALEVHVSLPGGGSYALAYADKAGADATLEHLKELLTPKKGKTDA